MKRLKQWIKNLLLGEKASSQAYVRYLRRLGMDLGEPVFIPDPSRTFVDITRPWMVKIGNNVNLARGVSIWTHGYDWCVLKAKYGDVLGSCGQVTIGDNVFVGVDTVILKGVTIGSNVIIGANSLVNKDIPDNCVAMGNPCKPVMSLEMYYEKRQQAQLEEARILARTYYQRTGQLPPKSCFHEFFWLFEVRTPQSITGQNRVTMEQDGNLELSMERFMHTQPLYGSFEEFLQDCHLTEGT